MEINKIYIGKVEKKPVKYVGYQEFEESGTFYHQFEYVIPNKSIIGYGQTDEQLKNEQYIICPLVNILYGR